MEARILSLFEGVKLYICGGAIGVLYFAWRIAYFRFFSSNPGNINDEVENHITNMQDSVFGKDNREAFNYIQEIGRAADKSLLSNSQDKGKGGK